MIENRTRQMTIQTPNAATGIHSLGPTSVANCSAKAIPPISAVTVIRLMKNEAPRLAAAARGPRRSRMISKVALPLTAATRPAMFANRQMPSAPTGTTQSQREPETGPDNGVGDQIADIEEAADSGQDAQRHRENVFHQW